MLIDAISPIVFDADLLSVGSPLDAVLTHRPQQKVAVRLPNPPFVRFIANAVGRFSEGSDLAEAASPKSPVPELFTRRNELVQDRDAGSVWPALASSFLWVNQPCRR